MTTEVRNTGQTVQMIGADTESGLMYLIVGDGAHCNDGSVLFVKWGCDDWFTRDDVLKHLSPKFRDDVFTGYSTVEFRAQAMHFVGLRSHESSKSVWLCNGRQVNTQGHEGRWEFRQRGDGDIMMTPVVRR